MHNLFSGPHCAELAAGSVGGKRLCKSAAQYTSYPSPGDRSPDFFLNLAPAFAAGPRSHFDCGGLPALAHLHCQHPAGKAPDRNLTAAAQSSIPPEKILPNGRNYTPAALP